MSSWLSVKEMAARLHTREEHVYQAIAAKRLKAYRYPGNSKGAIVNTEDADSWVRECWTQVGNDQGSDEK